MWEGYEKLPNYPGVVPLYVPGMNEGFHFSTSSPTLAIVFCILALPVGIKWYLILVLFAFP